MDDQTTPHSSRSSKSQLPTLSKFEIDSPLGIWVRRRRCRRGRRGGDGGARCYAQCTHTSGQMRETYGFGTCRKCPHHSAPSNNQHYFFFFHKKISLPLSITGDRLAASQSADGAESLMRASFFF